MPRESVCLKVAKANGEKTLKLADQLHITDKNLTIRKENEGFLCIPIVRRLSEQELSLLRELAPEAQTSTAVFREKEKKPKTLLDVLETQLPPHLLASVPKALDVVGDIAIVEIPAELEPHRNAVGEAILKAHRNVRTVLAKAGAVSGVYRLRNLGVIAGEPRTVTLHKENGCSYYVDVAKAYFSPRLSHEHARVASLVRDGETVVDLFAGVGPFAVLIAKTHPDARVYALDINADAVELLEKNIRLNRVENRAQPILGDARQIIAERLAGVADRVIMNLPEKAAEYVDVACLALKRSGGVVHFYGFFRSPDSLDNAQQRFRVAVAKAGRNMAEITCAKTVRETAPFEYQAVLDAEIR
ncbi:MAG: class I SAM-dependent methyltransferase family protein [Candidatus Bathyarchaeia archaeon]